MASTDSVATLHTSFTGPQRGLIIEATTMFSTMPPAWIANAWAPVLRQAASAPNLHLVHLGTSVLTLGDADSPCSGQTLWGDNVDSAAAGVAWDWLELREGVVAMSDPLGVVTNLQLIDARGGDITQLEFSVHLHQLVHALTW